MAMPREKLETLLRATFPAAEIELIDLAGDDDHWKAVITDVSFAGKTRVQQHQMVNRALGAHMGTTLHALQLVTRAP